MRGDLRQAAAMRKASLRGALSSGRVLFHVPGDGGEELHMRQDAEDCSLLGCFEVSPLLDPVLPASQSSNMYEWQAHRPGVGQTHDTMCVCRCDRRCTAMRSCGRHPCKRRCCDGRCPPCDQVPPPSLKYALPADEGLSQRSDAKSCCRTLGRASEMRLISLCRCAGGRCAAAITCAPHRVIRAHAFPARSL